MVLVDLMLKAILTNWEFAFMTSHKHLPIFIKSHLFPTSVAEGNIRLHHFLVLHQLLSKGQNGSISLTDPLLLKLCSYGFYMKDHKPFGVMEKANVYKCKGCAWWWCWWWWVLFLRLESWCHSSLWYTTWTERWESKSIFLVKWAIYQFIAGSVREASVDSCVGFINWLSIQYANFGSTRKWVLSNNPCKLTYV